MGQMVKLPNGGRFSEVEWRERVDLAACYRLIAHFGMTDLIYNHITARVPGGADGGPHILINAFGQRYEEITASSLFKIDLAGNVITAPDLPYGINHAGYIIHSAIHGARHDLTCVVHTHTRAGMAVAATRDGLLPISQGALRFYNRVAYHDFEGPAVEPDERQRLVDDLGDKDAMILRNHGLLVGGRSIPEAFLLMQRLEQACRVQVDVLSMGVPLQRIDQDVIEKSARVFAPPKVERFGEEAKLGDWNGGREWSAMIRMLDAIDPSYRT